MKSYEGEVSSPSDQIMIPTKPVFDPDEIFEFVSVYTADYDTTADSAVTGSIEAESQDTSPYDTDARFVSCSN